MPLVIANTYEVGAKIGQGTYSSIYEAKDRDGHIFAVKCETASAPKPVIHEEARIYRRIHYCAAAKYNGNYPVGFSQVYHSEELKDHGIRVMVLDRLGKSLSHYIQTFKRPFSQTTVLMIGIQMLHRLESLHEMNIVHRDIKPENILTGYEGNEQTLYICDFGLSRIFRTERFNHNPDIFGEQFSGLHHFAPTSAHLGIAQTQRDDLEGLGFCMIFFAKLELPWIPKNGNTVLGDTEMGSMKATIAVEKLCEDLPECFKLYMEEVKKLDFMQTPDYVVLHKILQDGLASLGGENSKFDWIK